MLRPARVMRVPFNVCTYCVSIVPCDNYCIVGMADEFYVRVRQRGHFVRPVHFQKNVVDAERQGTFIVL
ncbi:hypothetical protein QE152_g15296 [Popillia japonica]|uniref:Uncharacterized protein n=1 Tax=Popillia japonica TaxID=7064 RepID=A0AAW1L8V4_POPJA